MSDDDKPKKKPGPKGPPPLIIDADDPLGAWDKLVEADPERAKAIAQGRACMKDGCECPGFEQASGGPHETGPFCTCGHALAYHPQAAE